MGFDPQTAGQPLVNVHKRTTKVNLIMVVAVVLFLAAGIAAVLWAERTHQRGEAVMESPAPAK